MGDDIVTRLRAHLVRRDVPSRTHWVGCIDSHPICALAWALDEIERLRAEVVFTRAERDCAQIQADHLAQRLVKEACRG